MRTLFTVVCIIIVLPALHSSAHARLIENWPYERLFKSAAVVVIASAERTTATKDRLKVKTWNVEFRGRETTFIVRAVIKGSIKGKKFKVLHYQLPDDEEFANGPLLVSFQTRPISIQGTVNGKSFKSSGSKPEYLLFLKVRPDGRYELVSGQIDPELSVRELQRPNSLLQKRAGFK